MDLSNIKATALLKSNQATFLINKHSPELLLGAGIVGVITSTVLACRATLKAEEVLTKAKSDWKIIEGALDLSKSPAVDYSEEDYLKDRTLVTFQFLVNMAQLYGPSILIGSLSIAMLISGNRILSKRNAGLISAYKLIDEAFKSYRRRVHDELGEDVDTYFRYRKRYDGNMKVVGEKAKGKKINFDEVETADLPGEIHDRDTLGMPSPYAMFFDNSSNQWRNDNSLNEFFLRAQQTYANDMLNARGHVFLNEVYDMIGIPRTKSGAVVGWVKDHVEGDGYIDFDMFNPFNSTNRDFINGYQRESLLLDFNVDGVIFDLI